jgi:poly-gamma-glutamate capsule biosynthesis protein CapA/YwtB (metallophosphatase superfamily)
LRLPETPRDLFKFRPKDAIIYKGLIKFFELTGLWKRPIRAYGDFERMRLIDKIYWLYKTTNPIRKAMRGSGLETYFEKQKSARCELPAGFQIQSELALSSVGDLINHAYLTQSRDSLYAQVADQVFGADVTMANLECPIVRSAKKEFVFDPNLPPPLYYDVENFSAVKGYQGKKFSFMATACNHSLDFGPEGADGTVKFLNDEGIANSGVNADEKNAFRAAIIEKNGFKLGVVAYTFGLNGYRPTSDRPRIVNLMKLNDGVAANDFSQLNEQIEFCRNEGVDFVIAHLHWGLEHEFYPIPEQIELGHHVAELGVDAIIGHHPHVLQPMEIYRTKRDPRRQVPIYYSLGNLVNYFTAPYLCKSGIAQLRLAKGTLAGETPRVYVASSALSEVVQEVDEEKKQIRLVPA